VADLVGVSNKLAHGTEEAAAWLRDDTLADGMVDTGEPENPKGADGFDGSAGVAEVGKLKNPDVGGFGLSFEKD
jgi:hypothetical protein